MKFWGTGASEGIPNPFCACAVCENARRVGGKEVRTRSCFRLDHEVMIDLGPDFLVQSILCKEPLHTVHHIIYTHTHEDHLDPNAFWMRRLRMDRIAEPLTVYLTEGGFEIVRKLYPDAEIPPGSDFFEAPKEAAFRRLEFHKSYQIGAYTVTPLRGDHSTELEKNAANYLIETENLRLFYALDSGYFLDETVEKLKEGRPLDILVAECTFAVIGRDYRPNLRGHHDVNSCVRTLKRLYDEQVIDRHTKVYLSHIAAREATHEDLSLYFASLNLPYSVTVAYDGLEI